MVRFKIPKGPFQAFVPGCLLVLGMVGNAGADPLASGGPRLECTAAQYNFGTIMQGDEVDCAFLIRNAGDATLVISNVAPGCHCTTTGEWPHTLEPGVSGSIPLHYDSHGQFGEVHRSVRVESNDPAKPVRTLYLEGTVVKPFEIVPPIAYLQLPADPAVIPVVIVHITNLLDHPVTLSSPASDNPGFSGRIKIIKRGREYDVEVTAHPPFSTVGGNTANISLKTSLTNMPVLRLPVYAAGDPK